MAVLLVLSYYIVGRLPRSVAPGDGVVVFMYGRMIQDGVFAYLIFGSVIFFVSLRWVKSAFGFILLCAGAFALTGALTWILYSKVAAIAFDRDSVELRYP
ncbi:MAG TPA: hypothetical protein VJ032_12460 [Thermoanaerobaculia bacterium]|nr:hypothetical protein [Thermoanaerobaculia bacterium]